MPVEIRSYLPMRRLMADLCGGVPGEGLASGFEFGAVEPAEIGRQARRRSITGKFCFGAVPYTVQRHDCRGIIAAAAARNSKTRRENNGNPRPIGWSSRTTNCRSDRRHQIKTGP